MKGRFRTGPVVRIPVLALAGLLGTTSTNAENWLIVPSITVAETLTDNVELAPDNRKKSDLITQISPGIRIDGTGARVKLNLNYRLTDILYAHESAQNNLQHYLAATGMVEAVKNWLFIDASASISQQAISAFGSQPTSNVADTNVNNNRTQARAYQISPYIRGRFDATTDYLLRYRWSASSSGSQIGNVGVEEWIGSIRGAPGLARLGWTVDGSNVKSHPDVGPDVESRRLRGTLIYQFDPQLRFSVAGGLESNNYSGSNHGTGTYGAGFDWIPSVRTQASAFAEKRAFGNSHNFSLQHRTPRTVWRYRDNKDVTTTPNQLATVRSGTAFDLLFDALASQFPDPVLRGQEVQRRLQQSGTPADLIVPRTFLTTQVFQQRSREASVGLLGVRNTVTFTAVVTDGEAITPGAATARSGDFALAQNIRSRGITADWGHRLSPLSSLNVLASHVHSTAASASNLDSTQSMLRVALSHQLGRRTSASIGARMVRFDGSGTTLDYREKALTASVAVIF